MWPGHTTNRLYMHGGSIGHANPALGNVTYASGGGVYAPSIDRIFYMFGGAIYHNEAKGTLSVQGGGGVYPAANGTFVFNGGVIGGRWQGGSLVPAPNLAQRGGGIMLPAGVRLEMRGTPETTIIMSNEATLYGGGIYVTGNTWGGVPSVIMYGGTIGGSAPGHGNEAGISGGGVYVGPHANFAMRPGSVVVGGSPVATVGNISGNSAPLGGGINTVGGLTLEAGNIVGNEATGTAAAGTGLGGGVHVSDTTAILNFAGTGTVNIENNTARLGGGVYWLHGSLSVGATAGPINIRNNSATADGAGVWIGGSAPMPITANMNVYNNTATGLGGGVYVAPTGHLIMDSTTAIIGNTDPNLGNTATRGGGVFLRGTFTMSAGNILGNTATVNGGGVYMGATGANFSMQGAGAKIIDGNRAVNGAGVHWGQGNWTVSSNISIRNNIASGNGGGIHFSRPAAASIGNFLEIYGNTAVNGGGIMIDGNSSLTLTGITNIFDNSATQSGGGVFVENGSTLTSNSNTVTIGGAPLLGNTALRGGGVHLEGTFNFQAGTITGNSATGTAATQGQGGGIHFGHTGATLNMTGANVKNISNNTARWGGGVHWSQGTWTVAPGSGPINITGNNAAHPSTSGGGGGIHMSGARSLTLTSQWTISQNTARGFGFTDGGGGILMSGIGTALTINGGTITQNASYCFSDINSGGFGGGLHVFDGATVNMITGAISHNHADALGGGALFHNGFAPAGVAFTMSGGNINNNSASNGGGGLSIGITGSNDTYAVMTGGNIVYNEASHGGGVWLMHGILNMHGGRIDENIAGIGIGTHPQNRHGGGGGVMVCCTSRLYLHDGQINGNIGRVGGGVYISHAASSFPDILSYFTMYGGEINNNTATVDRFLDTNGNPYGLPNLEFDGDGGGIFITSTGFLTFEGPDIKRINNNTAENSGGGVRWVTGYWYTADNTSVVEFIGNDAAQDGGGIYIGGGMFVIVGGVPVFVPGSLTTHGTWNINNNEATRGGGVFVGGGYFLDDQNNPVHFASTLNLAYGAQVANNDTWEDGGGIFLYDGVNFNMVHGTNIHSNEAARNGGGVFVSNEAVFTMVGGLIGGGRTFITNPDAGNAVTISAFANRAQRGAGVYLTSGATFIMEQGTAMISGVSTQTIGAIRGNRASLGGGGVAVVDDDDDDVLFILRAGTIAGNLTPGGGSGTTAARVSGGGVLVAGENARFEMEGGTIDDNANPQWSGGGVTIMGGAEFEMTGGFITNNMARISGGGGVAVRHYGIFIMDGGTISYNESIIGGGVLSYNRGMFIMEDGLIYDNTIRGANNLGGGGLGVIAEADAIMRGGVITDHHLRTNMDDGGGVWVGEVLAAVNGGAHFEGVSTFIMEGGYIIDNSARRGGGVFGYGSVGVAGPPLVLGTYSEYYIDYSPEGGQINEAPHIQIESEWFQHLLDVAMERNSGFGIAPFSNDRSQFIMEGGTIEDNEASTNGGGVHAANGFLLFVSDNALIIDNLAAHDGGGIWIGEIDTAFSNPGTSILEMSGGTITENTANRRGGGIFIDDAEAEITGGEISENTATNVGGAYVVAGPWFGSGGGIYVSQDGLLSVEDAEIIGNHANQMGGGIFTELHQYYVATLTSTPAYSNLTIDASTVFDENTAGQGAFSPPTNAFAWTGIPGVAQGLSTSIHAHPINNYDINFRRVAPIPFAFHKANQDVIGNTSFVDIEDIEPYLLEGAYFTLFRFIGSGTVPNLAYAGSPLWEVVVANVRSSGDILDPIVMSITAESVYHLAEVNAPAGYQVPMGQWRITANSAAAGGLTITMPGNVSIPPFTYLDGYFYVGNRQDFNLPMTGGHGAAPYIYSGIGVIALAMVIAVYLYSKRKRVAAEV